MNQIIFFLIALSVHHLIGYSVCAFRSGGHCSYVGYENKEFRETAFTIIKQVIELETQRLEQERKG